MGCPYHRQDWSEESSARNAERRTYLHHRNRISRFVQSPRGCKLSGIATVYGSYEELLADPNIDIVYNSLPNQLHVPWTIKAAEAGKHVLYEKPISLTVAEAETLLDVRARTGVKIGEAFMIRTAPQWLRLRDVLREGRIGPHRSAMGILSYFNDDPSNIRSKTDCGGGGLMDIGCDLVLASRYAFQSEPNRVIGCLERDPRMQTDRLTSAILDFPTGPAVFTRSTQLVPYQWVQFFGGLKGGLRLRSLSMLLWIVPLAFLLTMVLICLEVASRRRPSLSRPVRYPRRCLFQGHPGGYRGADALGRGNQKYGCY